MEHLREKARQLRESGYSPGRIAFALGIRQALVQELLKLTPSEMGRALEEDVKSGKAQCEAVAAFELALAQAENMAGRYAPDERSKSRQVYEAYGSVDVALTRLRDYGLWEAA